jgi:hypothetical protein
LRLAGLVLGLADVAHSLGGGDAEARDGLEPERPPLLFVDGVRVCEATPLDRLANNKRRRRELPRPESAPLRTLKGPLDYIHDEYKALLRAYGEDLDLGDLEELDEQNEQEDRS